MQTLSQIKAMLHQRGLHPVHRLGQNFLHDQNQVRRLIDAAQIQTGKTILEVGPGTGTLTQALLESGANVLACEIDQHLADLLEETIGPGFGGNFTLLRGDCLDHGVVAPRLVEAIGRRSFQLVANLPYQAATALILSLLTGDVIPHAQFGGAFVTIQLEVAQRIASDPGRKTYGLLSVMARAFCHVEIIGRVPSSCFWPEPKVDSAMVSIVPCVDAPNVDRAAFRAFVERLFARRRKQIRHAVDARVLERVGIDSAVRAEQLSVDRIVDLYQAEVV